MKQIPDRYQTPYVDPREEKRTIGVCSDCKEWTTVEYSCCGAQVLIDGDLVRPDEESGLEPHDRKRDEKRDRNR